VGRIESLGKQALEQTGKYPVNESERAYYCEFFARRTSDVVMAGLVPDIHVFFSHQRLRTWMPGTSPGMTLSA
jgi:hypothetical protein